MTSKISRIMFVLFFVLFLTLSSFSAFAQLNSDTSYNSADTVQIIGFLEDFHVEAPALITADMCTPVSTTLKLTNVGSIDSGFSISAFSTAPWITLSPASFALAPGESELILEQFNVPCDESALGEYSVDIVFTTVFGLEKVLTQKVIVAKPENIVFSSDVYELESEPCSLLEFNLNVKNPSLFTEIYSLELDESTPAKLKNLAEFSEPLFSLDPAQSKDVKLSFDFSSQSCGLYGNFDFAVLAKTQITALTAATDFSLDINSAFIPFFTVPQEQLKLDFEGFRIDVPVKTSVPTSFDVELKSSNPALDLSWVWVEGVSDASVLSVGDEPAVLTLVFAPLKTLLVESELDTKTSEDTGSAVVSDDNSSITGDDLAEESTATTTEIIEGTQEGLYDFRLVLTPLGTDKNAEFSRDLSVLLKEPSFVEKLFTDYLWFTLGFLLLFFVLAIVLVMVTKSTLEYMKTDEYKQKQKERQINRVERNKRRVAEKKKRLEEWEKAREENEKLKEKLAEKKKRDEKREEERKSLEKRKIERAVRKDLKSEFRFIPKVAEVKKKSKLFGFFLLLLVLLFVTALGAALFFFWDTIFNNYLYLAIGLGILLLLLFTKWTSSWWSARKRREFSFTHLEAEKETICATGWKEGLGELSLLTKEPAENVDLTVTRSKKLPEYVVPKRVPFQYFSVFSKNLSDDEIKLLKFRFKVPKKWFVKNNVAPESLKAARYVLDGWQSVPTELISDADDFVSYQARFTKKGVFAILGKSLGLPALKRDASSALAASKQEEVKKASVKLLKAKKEKPKFDKKKVKAKDSETQAKRSVLGWFIFVLVLLFVFLLGSYYVSLIASVNLASDFDVEGGSGIPTQVWAQDTQHILDLAGYFTDPDGDTLEFSGSETDHVFISVDESLITFTPESAWVGEESVVFTADDGRGGTVDSNEVTLVVKEVKQFLPKSIADNVFYILLGIVILIVLLLLLEYRKPIVTFLEEEE